MADDEKPPEIDEHHFREARDFFFTELDGYMKKAARFADYCRRRDETKEQSEADPS